MSYPATTCDLPDLCAVPLDVSSACDLTEVLDQVVPDRPATTPSACVVGAFNSYV